jgi:hypothetical protein
MARFVKKRRSSSQDENVSLSHEQRMMPHPMNSTMPQLRHCHMDKIMVIKECRRAF